VKETDTFVRAGDERRTFMIAEHGTVEVVLRVTKEGKPEIFIDGARRGLLLTNMSFYEPMP